jgi:hypothetical protein
MRVWVAACSTDRRMVCYAGHPRRKSLRCLQDVMPNRLPEPYCSHGFCHGSIPEKSHGEDVT